MSKNYGETAADAKPLSLLGDVESRLAGLIESFGSTTAMIHNHADRLMGMRPPAASVSTKSLAAVKQDCQLATLRDRLTALDAIHDSLSEVNKRFSEL